jgi:hypothetical protein
MASALFGVLNQPEQWISTRHGLVVAVKRTPQFKGQLEAFGYVRDRLRWWLDRERETPTPLEAALLAVRMLVGVRRPTRRPLGAEPRKRSAKMKIRRAPQARSLPVSVRFPPELLDEVTAYSAKLGADRSAVIVACVRHVLEGDREWRRERRAIAQGTVTVEPAADVLVRQE